MIKAVNSEKMPLNPALPFSHSIAAGDYVFLSGQVGSGADGVIPKDIQEQTENVCKNLANVLEANGIGFENVVKCTCFLSDIANFAKFNEIYAKYFTGKPARSCFAVKDLPLGADVEIELIAYLGK